MVHHVRGVRASTSEFREGRDSILGGEENFIFHKMGKTSCLIDWYPHLSQGRCLPYLTSPCLNLFCGSLRPSGDSLNSWISSWKPSSAMPEPSFPCWSHLWIRTGSVLTNLLLVPKQSTQVGVRSEASNCTFTVPFLCPRCFPPSEEVGPVTLGRVWGTIGSFLSPHP